MKDVKTVAVIGTGTIGAGWAAAFLARGYAVRAFDPSAQTLANLPARIAAAWPTLRALDASTPERIPEFVTGRSMEEAIDGTQFVQESGPESEDLKIRLFADMDRAADPETVIASSSSSLLVSRLQSQCSHPERCLVGHPFNPPYLIPLVEIVAGPQTTSWAVDRSVAFYKAAGKEPLVLAKEITGYIANRLQNAIFKEAMHLVQAEVATIEDIDNALRFGPGLRWAFMGPFLTYALGGGQGGMKRYFEIFDEELRTSWADLGEPVLTDELRDTVIDQAKSFFEMRSIEEVTARRDQALVEVIKAAGRVNLTR